jgi:hypothetical protein
MDKVRHFGPEGPIAIGWAPIVMIGGGFGVGALVFAIAMFLKHA